MDKILVVEGILLNVDWVKANDVPVDALPRSAGVYAQIHWKSNGVRIGESSNIRQRHQESRSWLRGMHDGTADATQLRRNNVFCQAAKRDGEAGFGHCVISTDPALEDKGLRDEIERYLFAWVANHPVYHDFNFQPGYRNTLKVSVLEELEP